MKKQLLKRAGSNDLEQAAKMAALMWEDTAIEELIEDFSSIISKDDAILLMKYVDGEAVGFAQCQLRYDYVEGTDTSPVGYLEGIFVKEEYRNQGYAKELLCECERWAKEKGCSEFASDCELDNTMSLQFHQAMNFTETNRIICFAKKL